MYKIIGADGREYGPVPADVLRHWITEGRADAHTRTLAQGGSEWRSLAEFPEFSALLTGSPAAAPGAPAAAPGQTPKNNPLALTGLIMGILALTCGLCCFGLPFNVLGIVFSVIGLAQIKQDPLSQKGHGLAIAGLVLSLLSILLGLVLWLLNAIDPSDITRIIRTR